VRPIVSLQTLIDASAEPVRVAAMPENSPEKFRSFWHNGWSKAFGLQTLDNLNTGVVDQRKAMFASRSDVDVTALGILETQLRN